MALVDVNGMAARFIELSIEQFDKLIPGISPTDDQRERFYAPQLDKTKSSSENGSIAGKEVSLYPEVTRTVQSVLDATGKAGTKFRYLEHPNDKSRDGTNKRTDTVNDGGIYLNTEAARAATTKTTSRRGKKQPIEQPEHRGCRSWNYMAVPFEIKYDPLQSAFYTLKPDPPSSFKEPKKGSKEAEKASTDPTAPSGSHATSETQSTSRGRGKRGSAGKGRGRGGGKGRGKGQGKGKAKASPSPSMPPPPMPPPDPSTPDSGSVEPEQPSTPPLASAACPKQHTFIRDSIKGEEALAQFAEYMFNVFKHQHRVSAWAVYITFDHARLLFFDRVGAFVSQSFEWTKPDSLLHSFIWRLAHMSNTALGYDPSATECTKAELERLNQAKNKLSPDGAVRKYIEDQMGNGYPLQKLCVTSYSTRAEDVFPDERDAAAGLTPYPQSTSQSAGQPPVDDSKTWTHRYFIVGRPQFTADSLIGRCTRGFVAYDLTDDAFYHMKDLWRSWVPGKIRPEHLVYERLHKHNVQGIAPLICGGDVGGPCGQMTCVQDAFPADKRPVPRVHYRIVTGKIGVPLTSFKNFTELGYVLRGALTSHYFAWTRAKVLHRDISIGNILIDPETRTAILIDWDLSRLECELLNQPAEPDRTGTWQFRSGLSLRYPYKPYRVADDIESFVHVFHYLILRFHYTNVPDLFSKINILYQHSETINGIKVGGLGKIESFSADNAPFTVKGNFRLQMVLDELAKQCHASYLRIDHNHMERLFGMSQNQPETDVTAGKTWHGVRNAGEEDMPFDEALCPVDNPPPSESHASNAQCTVEGLLTKHGNLANILNRYAFPDVEDKGPDQFKSRALEDKWSAGVKTQHISHWSTPATPASRFGEEEDKALALAAQGDLHLIKFTFPPYELIPPYVREPSPEMFSRIPSGAFGPSAGPSGSMSGTRGSQKRPRDEGEGEIVVGDRFEEGDSDVRPVKRQGTCTSSSAAPETRR